MAFEKCNGGRLSIFSPHLKDACQIWRFLDSIAADELDFAICEAGHAIATPLTPQLFPPRPLAYRTTTPVNPSRLSVAPAPDQIGPPLSGAFSLAEQYPIPAINALKPRAES